MVFSYEFLIVIATKFSTQRDDCAAMACAKFEVLINQSQLQENIRRNELRATTPSNMPQLSDWHKIQCINTMDPDCPYHHGQRTEAMMILIFTRGQFCLGIVVACVCLCVRVCVCVCQSRVCPRYKSSAVQARITKFGSEVQNALVKIPVVWGRFTWTTKVLPLKLIAMTT